MRKELDNPKGKIDGTSLCDETKSDIAFNFQEAALHQLWDRIKNGLLHCTTQGWEAPQSIVVAGGVAANSKFREQAELFSIPVVFAPKSLCGDNATMIAMQAALCPTLQRQRQPFSRYGQWEL